MSATEVVIVDTGVANTASVRAAFERLGARVAVSSQREVVDEAGALVLPGVGAFGAGMELLERGTLDEALRRRVEGGRPTLAICLGMQLLGMTSEESPGVRGLGVTEWRVERFGGAVRVPQFGWNIVEPGAGCSFIERGYAYFANSYCVRDAGDGWRSATSSHDAPFVAGAERGGVLACQFHPELSGAWGMDLLCRWLEMAKVGGAAC